MEERRIAEVTAEQIQRDLQEYAIQFPHRALVDGLEVARAGSEVRDRSALDDLPARGSDSRR